MTTDPITHHAKELEKLRRMVDELTDIHRNNLLVIVDAAKDLRSVMAERDELRTELADSEAQREDCERCYADVKAKLAEAEACGKRHFIQAMHNGSEWAKEKERAEAAEARVKERDAEIERLRTQRGSGPAGSDFIG